jgi:hypothetical protein
METWKRVLLRSAAFGGGFAVVTAVIIGGALWWSSRAVSPKPWNTNAVTPAGKNGLLVQVRQDIFHIEPRCNLKNNTSTDYKMPSAESGTLMSVNPDNGGLEKLAGVTWDPTVVIFSGQSVNVKFDIPYTLTDYGETASSLADDKKLIAFADRRLKDLKHLKFFDGSQRYEIDCPNSWNDK